MYKKAQTEMKLDGVITEFCDIYAPISQIYKEAKPSIKIHKLTSEEN